MTAERNAGFSNQPVWLSLPCPTCAAAPGHRCLRGEPIPSGVRLVPSDTPHPTRVPAVTESSAGVWS